MIARETSVAGVTERVAEPAMLPDVAVIVETPAETPVAIPFVSTVMTVPTDEVHCTSEEIFCVVPSE